VYLFAYVHHCIVIWQWKSSLTPLIEFSVQDIDLAFNTIFIIKRMKQLIKQQSVNYHPLKLT